jgi:hypothetical protein
MEIICHNARARIQEATMICGVTSGAIILHYQKCI